MDIDNYPVKLSLRLDWSEMDLFGHINNVSYFKYVQASRVNYWETAGINSLKEEGVGPMLLSTSCRFIQPLFYPGNILIKASVTFMKNTSFGISHRILNQNGDVVAEAEDIIVMYDFNINKKISIPDTLRRRIAQMEDKEF